MNEIAWCYLEGFGCKKDKVSLSMTPRPVGSQTRDCGTMPTSCAVLGLEPHDCS